MVVYPCERGKTVEGVFLPFLSGGFSSPGSLTGGASTSSRCQGLFTWCCRTLSSCSRSSSFLSSWSSRLTGEDENDWRGVAGVFQQDTKTGACRW
jgi:hypothetical protein